MKILIYCAMGLAGLYSFGEAVSKEECLSNVRDHVNTLPAPIHDRQSLTNEDDVFVESGLIREHRAVLSIYRECVKRAGQELEESEIIESELNNIEPETQETDSLSEGSALPSVSPSTGLSTQELLEEAVKSPQTGGGGGKLPCMPHSFDTLLCGRTFYE